MFNCQRKGRETTCSWKIQYSHIWQELCNLENSSSGIRALIQTPVNGDKTSTLMHQEWSSWEARAQETRLAPDTIESDIWEFELQRWNKNSTGIWNLHLYLFQCWCTLSLFKYKMNRIAISLCLSVIFMFHWPHRNAFWELLMKDACLGQNES